MTCRQYVFVGFGYGFGYDRDKAIYLLRNKGSLIVVNRLLDGGLFNHNQLVLFISAFTKSNDIKCLFKKAQELVVNF